MAYQKGPAMSWVVFDVENQLNFRASSSIDFKTSLNSICSQFDIVDPRVARYDWLALIEFSPGTSIMVDLQELMFAFRDIGGLYNEEKLRLYAWIVPADLQCRMANYQQSKGSLMTFVKSYLCWIP